MEIKTITAKIVQDNLPMWAQHILLAGFRGSIAHGTMVEQTDDVDLFAVFMHPRNFYLGLDGFVGKHLHHNSNGEYIDMSADELRRFVDFLKRGNPNSHMALWLRPEHYILVTPVGESLLSHRDVFISKHILRAILGHTKSQLKKSFNPFNAKAAAHALRLTFLGMQLIKKNSLHPWLEGSELTQVLNIKAGRVSENKTELILQQEYTRLCKAAETSILPEEVHEEEANTLLLDLLNLGWSS